MKTTKLSPSLWAGQSLHLIGLIIFLCVVGAAWNFLEKPFPVTFLVVILLSIVHLVFVWLACDLNCDRRPLASRSDFQDLVSENSTFYIDQSLRKGARYVKTIFN